MDIFDVLTLIGGLCLFLFGMNLMGDALERRAGGKLEVLLGKLTTNKWMGLLTGLAVTAVIQSSSATTVMVVGFVNSGLMSLSQSINVIMGANIGTTVTAWILSLSGISSGNIFVQLLKPTSFTPILALIGIICQMFGKDDKKKDTGMILLGFATLMFGMDAMSGAVSSLKDVPQFQQLFVMFKNPILGVIAGAILTAIIQSSSASVGILQALAVTGQISMGAAIPIIMGQNIGTCITAILSSLGTNKNAKRAALVHLCFNVIGTIVWVIVFWIIKATLSPALFDQSANALSIAIAHSIFNVACTLLMLPLGKMLEKLVYKLVPQDKTPDVIAELDERLLATPAVALERAHALSLEMAECSIAALKGGLQSLTDYTAELAKDVREKEEHSDHFEDIIGTYLVKLSSHQIGQQHSSEAAMLLKMIGDFERISDHSVNLIESAEELRDKGLSLTTDAMAELKVLISAVDEILDNTLKAFAENDYQAANKVEPLEQIIDRLKEQMRTRHIQRLQRGGCSIEAGFVWNDLLTNLERTSDHCSNIAGCLIDVAQDTMNIHETLHNTRHNSLYYQEKYEDYARKYQLPK